MESSRFEFMFECMPVGFFEESDFPARDGTYRYMPYRGLGHYRMVISLKETGMARCSYHRGSEWIGFVVRSRPEYGVLELVDFEVINVHEPKILWRIARARAARSSTGWISASRDSATAVERFRAWLTSLPICPPPCYFITGPHSARAMTWSDACRELLSCFPESGEVHVLGADLLSVVTLSSVGVARFTSANDA